MTYAYKCLLSARTDIFIMSQSVTKSHYDTIGITEYFHIFQKTSLNVSSPQSNRFSRTGLLIQPG